ncbi:MAG: TolC family protein [Sulfurimonadaceae bacterium]|nr:TolC family protein [Sulfurimonadaceae bacterium]
MKKLFLACSILFAPLAAQEQDASFEGYLSELKERQFALEQRNIDAQASTLRDSWIQPIRLQYTHTESDPYGNEQTTKNAAITIDQPIFKSGGIYYAIKYADATHQNASENLAMQRRALIKQAVSLLMQYKQSALMIEKQNLLIANAKINLEQKREQYMNGQIDSGFLNTAMIESNRAQQALYDLQTGQARLKTQFTNLSDLDPDTARTPHLKLLDETDFIAYNIEIKQRASETEMNRYNKDVTFAKYLPQFNIVAGYNRDQSEGVTMGGVFNVPDSKEEYYNYGFKATMALDINSISDNESARVTYLKSQVLLDDKKRELRALYQQVSDNLQNSDRKIELARSNQRLYGELLSETQELYKAGYKTEFDVRNLENSVAIQRLDTKIFEYDKQLELLNLYEKVTNEIQ